MMSCLDIGLLVFNLRDRIRRCLGCSSASNSFVRVYISYVYNV